MAKLHKELIARLRLLRARIHREPGDLRPGYSAPITWIAEFNELVDEFGGQEKASKALGGKIEFARVSSSETYAEDVDALGVEKRVDRALAVLGASVLADTDELRAFIQDKFADSHLLIPKRQAWLAILIVVLAMFGLNWTSVRLAINSSAVVAATREAESARDAAVGAADTIDGLLQQTYGMADTASSRLQRLEVRSDALLETIGALVAHYRLTLGAIKQFVEEPAIARLIPEEFSLVFRGQSNLAEIMSLNVEKDIDRVSAHSPEITSQRLSAGADHD